MPIGKIEAFDETNNDWNAYVERVEQYFFANEIKDNKQVAVMLSLIQPVFQDYRKNTTEASVTETTAHSRAIPLSQKEPARRWNRKFLPELKKLLLYCEFGTNLNVALRDRLVCGLHNELIQKRLLSEPDLPLVKASEIALAREAAAKDTL